MNMNRIYIYTEQWQEKNIIINYKDDSSPSPKEREREKISSLFILELTFSFI